jgi:hypothetical protein
MATAELVVAAPPVIPDKERLIAEEVTAVEAFINQEGGMKPTLEFASTRAFVERCYEVHESLIRRWGGWEYAGDPVQEESVPKDVVRDIWKGVVYGGVPEMMNSYGFATKTWTGGTAPFQYSHRCYVPLRKGQLVSRKVLADVAKLHGKDSTNYTVWSAFFEKLGHLWKAKDARRVVVSCAPSRFMWLGSYGENSCYKPGDENEHSRLNLPLIPNSVILLMYETAPFTTNNVKGRMWGLCSEKSGFILCNKYLFTYNTWAKAVNAALAAALGVPIIEQLPLVPDGPLVLHDINGSDIAYVNIGSELYFALDGRGGNLLRETHAALEVFREYGKEFEPPEIQDDDYDDEPLDDYDEDEDEGWYD